MSQPLVTPGGPPRPGQLPRPLAVPPKHLRMVDAELMKIEGIQVLINESFRVGVLMLETGTSSHAGRIVCSTDTLAWLDNTERKGGREWGIVANLLRNEIRQAGADMVATKMVDLTAKGHKVVDRRRVSRPSTDRMDALSKGISDLTGQMAAMLSGQVQRSPEHVSGMAKRYAQLAGELSAMRSILTGVEGMFDIAQTQVMALMGDDTDG